jgi:hypothetical protein
VIKSRRMKWAGHVTSMEDRRGAYRVSVGKTDGNRPLGIPKHRWENNIKIYHQEMEWGRNGQD